MTDCDDEKKDSIDSATAKVTCMPGVRHFVTTLIPQFSIYTICAYYFVLNIVQLVWSYSKFQTIVMIQYQMPEVIHFPAFTICGCCVAQSVVQNRSSKVFRDEFAWMGANPPDLLFQTASYRYTNLVPKCSFIRDTRQPDNKVDCDQIEPVLESVVNGRKCFTFFTSLSMSKSVSVFGEDNVTDDPDKDKTESFTSKIYLEVAFPVTYHDNDSQHWVPVDNSLQNSDVVFSIHPPTMLPTMLDTEFFRLDASLLYDVQFSKQIANLLPKPYQTACESYNEDTKPRSQNECINMCIAEMTYGETHCINYYSVLTKELLQYVRHKFDSQPQTNHTGHYCPSRGYLSYYQFVKARRQCSRMCARNCVEENYKISVDVASSEDQEDDDGQQFRSDQLPVRTSNLVIWPSREMYQSVQHEGELNFFELIGCLGGHAHLWLGLSAIQFFDVVVVRMIARVRFVFDKVLYRFQSK